VLLLGTSYVTAATNEIQFNRDIRPILSENCYVCHGHDKNNRKAKLRLDDREVALEREAIIPGKPDQSKLVQHIFSTDSDEIMPPPKTHKTLTTAQKELLKNWIAGGAQYEPHWAYIPPKRFAVPQSKNQRWVRNPIDAFILHTLEAKNIQPSNEADKRTLLRRIPAQMPTKGR
jgi:Planctomycete cytochrome C